MRGARGWVIAAGVVLLIAAAAYFGQPRADSPEHSSSSDAANGTSAARLFAAAMGHPVDQVAGGFSLPDSSGIVFVFTPTSPFSPDEARQTLQWVRSGGTLVYASEQGDPELDNALGVARGQGPTVVTSQMGNPVVDGVGQVAGGNVVIPVAPTTDQVPVLRTQSGQVTAYLERVDRAPPW